MKRCPWVPLQPFSFAALFPADLYYCACVDWRAPHLTILQACEYCPAAYKYAVHHFFFVLLPLNKHVVEGVCKLYIVNREELTIKDTGGGKMSPVAFLVLACVLTCATDLAFAQTSKQ